MGGDLKTKVTNRKLSTTLNGTLMTENYHIVFVSHAPTVFSEGLGPPKKASICAPLNCFVLGINLAKLGFLKYLRRKEENKSYIFSTSYLIVGALLTGLREIWEKDQKDDLAQANRANVYGTFTVWQDTRSGLQRHYCIHPQDNPATSELKLLTTP